MAEKPPLSPLLPASEMGDGGAPQFLIKVDGVWIYRGVADDTFDWDAIIDDTREERAVQGLGWQEPSRLRHHVRIDSSVDDPYGLRVPTVSIFVGIEIRMYFRDHAPPHFHAFYHNNEVLIDISTLETIRGSLPRRALGLVLNRPELHRGELNENWKRAQQHLELSNIDPLE